MLVETVQTLRDLGRLEEIAMVLVRYGFGELVDRLGVRQALAKAGRSLHLSSGGDEVERNLPERMRRALEEMGPTFIKFGQIIATRADLLPPDWLSELAMLQRHVPPVPFEQLREALEHDLGSSPAARFAHFDTRPMAAASIAQIHAARLRDGTDVIVKIRRPGIQKVMASDLRLMSMLARLIEFEFPSLAAFHPVEVVSQFGLSIDRELNFVNECRNTDRMRELFAGNPAIVIPRVYWDFVSERVAVLERIRGTPSWDDAAIRAAGLNRLTLAQVGADAVLRMILIEGFFHADPHDGNLLYLPGNRMAFIDFGIVGRLTPMRRRQVVDLLLAIAERDGHGAADVLLEWADCDDADFDRLSCDMEEFIGRYYGASLKHVHLPVMLSDLGQILRRHKLRLPPDLVLLFRALVALDGMGRQNDPNFDVFRRTEPWLKQALAQRYAPATMLWQSRRNLATLFDLAVELPADLRRVVRSFRKGQLKINADILRLDNFGWQIERAASWLTVGLVTAAMIVGSSIAMTVGGGPTLFGLPALGLIGYSAAAVGAVWLLFSIWKSMHRHGP